MTKFALSKEFVASYAGRVPPFGFAGLGQVTYMRTYARENERWMDTVERVVNGTFRMMQAWIEYTHKRWKADKAQRSAQQMYRLIFDMKFLPPGRGLFCMGTPVIEERKLYAALNNCAMVSTLSEERIKPFLFLMDVSMLGVGVGFDTKGAGSFELVRPEGVVDVTIEDSREGWVHGLETLLGSYFYGWPAPRFDYSQIRTKGSPIRGFGGTASGPQPLIELFDDIKRRLEPCIGRYLSKTNIVDIMNLLGRCVVAGNVRRVRTQARPLHPLVSIFF